MIVRLFFIFLGTAFSLSLLADNLPSIVFEKNKTQWTSKVLYKSDLPGISLFMEQHSFTYVVYDANKIHTIHEQKHASKNESVIDESIQMHAFQMAFKGANPHSTATESNELPYYSNYFIGNDSSKWSSNVHSYETVMYSNLYNHIDLKAYQSNNQFKYDFIVNVGGNPEDIVLEYNGVDKLAIKNNQLIIKTSVGEIIEGVPYSYQIIDGIKHEVACDYKLASDGKHVYFSLPNNYNKNYGLIIDPTLVAATYSGSTRTVYGYCATYDYLRNIYKSSPMESIGYPITFGAYQTSYKGGSDIVISKLTPNGSNLIWSTYLGGENSEDPYSLCVNSNNELYVLGVSTSTSYPTTFNCFDNTLNTSGNTATTDLVITHFNTNCTALIGSTYVGGDLKDGTGYNSNTSVNANDHSRSELIVDKQGNAWVASYTQSLDFPTTSGTYQQIFSGGNFDGVAFKVSSNMSSLLWGTYFGGSSIDIGFSLRLNSNNELYVTGFTESSNFPTTTSAYQTNLQGGKDGFIVKFTNTGSAISSATFFGTPQNDISYFLDIDQFDYPYIFGTSEGNMPVTSSVYHNSNGKNFITKLDTNLNTLLFSTVFGGASNTATHDYLNPQAFMIDCCANIYISGFVANDNYPTTNDALLTNTNDGNNSLYFMVLTKDAQQLKYGSFYYGDHVDGGISRFSPSGQLYQAICVFNYITIPTPPWAFKNADNPNIWDAFVMKLDFEFGNVKAKATSISSTCPNKLVSFNNTSNGKQYIWYFGDGASSTSISPTHSYSTPGTYTVSLIAFDSTKCNASDTTKLTILVRTPPYINLGNDTTICNAFNLTLTTGNNTPGNTYLWFNGNTTNTINVNTVGNYWATINDGVCINSDTITIRSLANEYLGRDTSLCDGETLVLNATNISTNYLWSTGATTSSISVTSPGTYWLNSSTSSTCTKTDTLIVSYITPPTVTIPSQITLCPNEDTLLIPISNSNQFIWSTGAIASSILVNSSGNYVVKAYNQHCWTSDTSTVDAIPSIQLPSSINFCNNSFLTLDAGVQNANYIWSTNDTTQTITINNIGIYWVTAIKKGCVLSDTIVAEGIGSTGIFNAPNVFTPNNDNVNDYFTLTGNNLDYFELTIYNRWGELVYSTNNQTLGWDGKHNGKPVSDGVYFWKLDYKTICQDKASTKAGHVSVFR